MRAITLIVAALLLAACGGGGGAASPTPVGAYALAGQFQKGPFSIGSQVSANVLDGTLNPTGIVYNVQTTDNLGHFSVPSGVSGNLIELVGDGFYMDELTGQLSTTRIQLRAFVDLNVSQKVTVNILTSLQWLRLKKLISQGTTYSAAYTQSRNEVLIAFGIDPTKINSLSTLYSMDITGSTDSDSVLLAISSILSKMATNAAVANSTSQPAELSNYVNTIAAQIENTGLITSVTYISEMSLAATQINLAAVRSNVETYYASRGISVVAPKFEEWVDKDASGILPRRLMPVTGLSFTNVTSAEPSLTAGPNTLTSNTISIVGIGPGTFVPIAALNENTTIIKNGSVVSGAFSTMRDGDTLAIRTTAGGWGAVVSPAISVGSSSTVWSVTSRSKVVTFFQGPTAGVCTSTAQFNPASTYVAIPFRTDQVDFLSNVTVASRYIALGLNANYPIFLS